MGQLSTICWDCTQRCNLKCRHCGLGSRRDNVRRDMPLGDFLNILTRFETIYDLQRVFVGLTGGEPTLREDILECIRKIKMMGCQVGMVSNGYKLAERIGEFRRAGLDVLSISLDGPKEVHNWMRQSDSAYQHAVEAISACRRFDSLPVDVITSATPKVLDHLDELYDLLMLLKVKSWRLTDVIPIGWAKENPEVLFTWPQREKLLNRIAEYKAAGDMQITQNCGFFCGPDSPGLFGRCLAGDQIMTVKPNGDIAGCMGSGDFIAGNVYQSDILDIWTQGMLMYRDRSWMKCGVCDGCPGFDRCMGGPIHLRDKNTLEVITCPYQDFVKETSIYESQEV